MEDGIYMPGKLKLHGDTLFQNAALDLCRVLDLGMSTKKRMIYSKEKEAVMNLIYKDYC